MLFADLAALWSQAIADDLLSKNTTQKGDIEMLQRQLTAAENAKQEVEKRLYSKVLLTALYTMPTEVRTVFCCFVFIGQSYSRSFFAC